MLKVVFALSALAVAQPEMVKPEAYFPSSLSKQFMSCGSWSRRRSLPVLSSFENKWFSGHLVAANEPSLLRQSKRHVSPPDSIRFTWLRTFHQPVIVRVEGLWSPTARLIAKELSGKGGYEPGVVAKRLERLLTTTETASLRRTMMRLRASHVPSKDCDFGLDGSVWLAEVADRSGYHFAVRWSPTRGEIRYFGLTMLTLTGWKFEEVY